MIRARIRPVEGLYRPHATAATWACRQVAFGGLLAVTIIGADWRGGWRMEQLATKRQLVRPVPIGE